MFKNILSKWKILTIIAILIFVISLVSLVWVNKYGVHHNKEYISQAHDNDAVLIFYECGIMSAESNSNESFQQYFYYLDGNDIMCKSVISNGHTYTKYGELINSYTYKVYTTRFNHETQQYEDTTINYVCTKIRTQMILSWVGLVISIGASAVFITLQIVENKKKSKDNEIKTENTKD